MQSINTSLLSLVALILYMAAYCGFGVQVRFQQTIGAFIIIVGSLCMYIALSGAIEDHSGSALRAKDTPIATTILSLNSIASICFSGVFVILKVNHQQSQIKWHSGLMVISFISFLTSAIILVALQCLTLLINNDVSNEGAPSQEENWSAKKQLMQISISSTCFALGLLALGAVLNQKPNTRCLALLAFIPMT